MQFVAKKIVKLIMSLLLYCVEWEMGDRKWAIVDGPVEWNLERHYVIPVSH